jgi:hypothetical protein
LGDFDRTCNCAFHIFQHCGMHARRSAAGLIFNLLTSVLTSVSAGTPGSLSPPYVLCFS